MTNQAIVVVVYGILLILGGIMGYAKAASVASLVMGIIFGAGLLASAWGMFNGVVWASYVALALTVFLTAFFAYRFSLSKAFMPAGLMIIIGIIVLIVLILMFYRG